MSADPTKARILIVDDVPANIKILSDVLQERYHISYATNGKKALEIVASTPPEMILLDINMPKMDGYEVCASLKSQKSTHNIPVIFVTTLNEGHDEEKGFQLGAVDYITKPFIPAIVRARVKTHLALQAALGQLVTQNEILRYEREVVETVVTRMGQSIQFDDSHLRVLKSPVDRTSGDLLLATFSPRGHQHILLGDFTGHGLTAAIGGPIVSDIFYSRTSMGFTMEHIVSEVNKVLCEKLPDNMFMVGCFLDVDRDRQEITIWNCAMPDTIIFRDGKPHRRVPSSHMARGFLLRMEKPGTVLPIHQGDKIFIYTDGISEEINMDSIMFGVDILENILTEIVTSGKPLEIITDALERYREGQKQHDDIIIVELTC